MVFVATLGRLRSPLLRARPPSLGPRPRASHPRASSSLGRSPLPGETPITSADVAVNVLAGAIAAAVLSARHESRSNLRKLGFGGAHFVTSPVHLMGGRYYTLLTSTLIQQEFTSTVASIGAVLVLGRRLALHLGSASFLCVYGTCGAVSSLVAVQDLNRRGEFHVIVGGVAAANAIAAMSLVLFPRATVFLGLPMWVVASVFLAPDCLRILSDRLGNRSQHLGNLCGAACGGAYALYLRKTLRCVR